LFIPSAKYAFVGGIFLLEKGKTRINNPIFSLCHHLSVFLLEFLIENGNRQGLIFENHKLF